MKPKNCALAAPAERGLYFAQYIPSLGQDVRGRWTQLRQNFSKKFKRTLADDDAVEQLKEHKLAFLIPFIKHSADGG